MASRLNLHEELCSVLGSRNVYYQPPSGVKMKYPAIRYSLDKRNLTYADGVVYNSRKAYQVIVIDTDPDSELPDILETNFQAISFENNYVSDGLYHTVYVINY